MPSDAYNRGFSAGEKDRHSSSEKEHSQMPGGEIDEYRQGYFDGAFGTGGTFLYSQWANGHMPISGGPTNGAGQRSQH